MQMGTTHRPRRARHLRAVARRVRSCRAATRADSCCDVTEPWLTTLRGLASYTRPEGRRAGQHDDPVGAHRRERERQQRHVARRPTTRSRTPSCSQLLGRLPAGASAAQNTTVNLLAPSELYPLERRTEVDIRLAKILRFGRIAARRRRRPLQPVQREHDDDLPADVPLHEQRRDLAGADGHPGAAARAVQRHDVVLIDCRFTAPPQAAARRCPGDRWRTARSAASWTAPCSGTSDDRRAPTAARRRRRLQETHWRRR